MLLLCVAEAGSLSRAALVLSKPQSMVRRAVAQRENGKRLFVRTGRGVLPTEFATQWLPRVARLLAHADALVEDMRSARGQPMGDVRPGLLPSAVRRFAGPLALAMRQRWPAVRLHLVEGASATLEEQLREGRLDAPSWAPEFLARHGAA